jgi:hypothetical protein
MLQWATSKAVSRGLARSMLFSHFLIYSHHPPRFLLCLPAHYHQAFIDFGVGQPGYVSTRSIWVLQSDIPPPVVARRGYAEVFSRSKPHMNIGTIGSFSQHLQFYNVYTCR